jgi:hypothetical protein
LIEYINEGRKETAMRAQCCRVLTPVSGSIVSWTVTNGGSGYSANPTLTITAPDFPSGAAVYPNGMQATATAIVQNGVIVNIFSQFGGAGYWQPIMTITDATGTGATATPVVSYINQVAQGQEVYPFSAVDLSAFPGAESIYMVKSVSILYSGFRYSLACYAFSTYQALIRQWALQWQYTPVVCAQYGQGTSGSFYMYPIPSQPYQVEFDAFVLPQALEDDQSFEILPDPWTHAVPYWACRQAFLELQNFNAAKFYEDLYDRRMLQLSQHARPGRTINPYGRP